MKEYLKRTSELRDNIEATGQPRPTQLFLSWATKKPVTKQTISRWLKTTLDMAGIDTKQFSAHSFRGAGLSAAQAKGATLEQIVCHGDWKNVSTFKTHYAAPSQTTEIGKIILNEYSKR